MPDGGGYAPELLVAAASLLEDPYLRLATVEKECGLSRSAIYRRIAAGTFPAPRQLGGGVVRWPSSVIAAWKEAPDTWRARQPAEKAEVTPPAVPPAPSPRGRGRPRRPPAA